MSLFSGLEKLGLKKLSDVDIYEEVNGHKKDENTDEQAVPKTVIKEEDFLFDKSYSCPVCDEKFISKTVKTGKVKTISHDSDLRPVFQGVDVLKYDVVVCPKCGFSAITRCFKGTSTSQNKWIKEQISANFNGFQEPQPIYTYDNAIMMHKLALVSTIVKRGKISERAYCCLKLAWLIRGKWEQTIDEEEKKSLKVEELECIEKAYDGFEDAFSKETFPMCGMDELTVDYLVSDLARQLGRYDVAERWISRVILSKMANGRIKDKARELKSQIASDRAQSLNHLTDSIAE